MTDYNRLLKLTGLASSAFLFGPRMVGKTHLLRALAWPIFYDLLDPEEQLRFSQSPKIFWEEISSLSSHSKIIVDEIQRVPALLDYVQMGIDRYEHQFILSGSSARKLKRGGVNLLGGRAIDLKLHPLTQAELGSDFSLDLVLQYGSLPKVYQLLTNKKEKEAKQILRSYYTIYIKEEIQAEALTRNVGAFQRFLNVAAQSNGQIMEFSNIARECAVPASTVKEYFSILEDTLLGSFLWPWDRSERKKARPKFYFFDCGVVRAIQNRLNDPPTPMERGTLFETWFLREITRIRDYFEKDHEIHLWREGAHEVDFVISNAKGFLLAIECKTGKGDPNRVALARFKRNFPKTPIFIVSDTDVRPRKLESNLEVLPWRQALELYMQMK